MDTFRKLNPNRIKYSWWSYMFKSRDRNIGWRLDYILISKSIFSLIKSSEILTKIYGSDHCPIVLEIEIN